MSSWSSTNWFPKTRLRIVILLFLPHQYDLISDNLRRSRLMTHRYEAADGGEVASSKNWRIRCIVNESFVTVNVQRKGHYLTTVVVTSSDTTRQSSGLSV